MRNRLAFAPALALLLLSSASVHAQWLDRERQSPMALMDGPIDGVAYFQARQRAIQLQNQRDFVGAESIFVRLAKEYPRDGMNWLRLAQAQLGLRKFADAATSFERIGPLMGWGPFYIAGTNVARFALAAGDPITALKLIEKDVFERGSFLRQNLYDDPAWAALKDSPEFKRITGRPDTKGWTRNEGWQHDIDYIREEIARTSPDFRGRALPAEFMHRYEQLRRDVPKLSDEEIFVGMNRMIATLHAGHTSLFLPTGSRYLPLRPYAFPEGVFIIEAADSSLVGSRIVRIGRMSTDSIFRVFAQSKGGDGDMELLWLVSSLEWTHLLKGVGAIARTDSVPLVVQSPSGVMRTVTLATNATPPQERQDKLLPPRGVTAPMFLRNLSQVHWEQALPDYDALYLQVNNIQNDADETLQAFGARIGAVLDASKPKNVIIDLRHNNGGNTTLYVELLRTLIAYTRTPGTQVYALIGRRSYSATGNFVTDLERLVRPIWIGEASSECCNLHGDPTPVTLPYSRIQGEFSVVRWNYSINPFDGRREMSPDVPVQLTAKAYFAGQDPALDATLRLIRERSVKP